MLGTPVDGASLAAFRLVFGSVMLWQSWRFLWPHPGGSALQAMYAPDQFHFPYPGLSWLQPLPLVGMQVVFVLLGIAACCMLLGIWYRAAAVTVFLTWTYFFLSDQAYYQNHYYLISLFAGILIFCPADQCFSLASWQRNRTGGVGPRSESVPFWSILLLRAQLFFMYFFAGIAKIDVDWLTGIPIRGGCGELLERLSDIGIHLSLTTAQLAWLLAWAGFYFDLAIGPMLIIRRTRLLALTLVMMFHGMNEVIFDLAALPYLAAGTTLIFCEPDWPRTAWNWLRRPSITRPDWKWLAAGAALLPPLGLLLGWSAKAAKPALRSCQRPARGVLIAVAVFLLFQALFPLRHLVISGDPDFTEEGYRFSWRMMQRTQAAFHIDFRVQVPGLTTPAPDGAVAVDWSRWLGERPRTLFVSTDAEQIPWEQLPEIVLVYEPALGYRVIGNPLAAGATATDPAWMQRLTDQWRQRTGRRVTARPTIPLAQALEQALAAVLHANDPPSRSQWSIHRLESAQQISAGDRTNTHRTIELIDATQQLVQGRYGPAILKELRNCVPFALQGAQPDVGFVVLDDPTCSAEAAPTVTLHDPEHHPSLPVLFDPSRLRTYSWRSLPQALLCEDARGTFVTWNHHRDLTDRQIRRMAMTPGMIHCYAQSIHRRWQDATHIRPQVFVNSTVSHNRRPHQPIVNPQVDLAAAELKWFGHNDWIAELSQRPAASVSEPVARAASQFVVLSQHANGKQQLTREQRGDERSIVRQWDSSGRLVLEAEYLQGKLHGKQSSYHANGQLAQQMEYRHGMPHGIAIQRDAAGALTSRVEYQAGVPAGPPASPGKVR
jgi:hypothetical protein